MYDVGDGIRVVLLRSGLSPAWWPFAGRYICAAICCTSPHMDSKCPYEIRYPDLPLPKLQPFGRNVSVVRHKTNKAEPRGVRAIYLGHVVHDGGIVSQHEIYYALLDYWINDQVKSKKVSSTRDFRFESEVSFPIFDLRVQKEYLTFNNKEEVSITQFRDILLGQLGSGSTDSISSTSPPIPKPVIEIEEGVVEEVGLPDDPDAPESVPDDSL